MKYTGNSDIDLLAAKIRRFGYSHRIPIATFVQRYGILVYPATADLPLTRETCENILHKLKMQNWTIGLYCFFLIIERKTIFLRFHLGKSKVFLKYYHAEQLTRLHSEILHAVVTIQSYVRMRITRSYYKHRYYKHSNDMMIQELHRHPKFSRVCLFSRSFHSM